MASVTVSGSAVKQVKCEKCPCEYVYEMVARNTCRSDSSGYAIAGGMIGGAIGGAIGGTSEEKLRAQAQVNVNRKLAKGCEPVPCPACGWYQTDMVKESRRRYRKPMLALGATLMVIGSALLFVLLAMNSSPYSGTAVSPIAFVIAGAIGLSGVAVLVWRWSLQRAYDINQGYPAPRPPYVGSPQGFDAKNLAKAAAATPAQARSPLPPPPPPLAADWYYTQGDSQVGPVTWADLKAQAAKGTVGALDLVYASGSADWVEASSVPGLLQGRT